MAGATNSAGPIGPASDRAIIEELPLLSAERAFMVQFRSGSGPRRFAGRVEHMPSVQAADFGSEEELLAFLTGVLAEVRD